MRHLLAAAVTGISLMGAANAATINTTYQVSGNPFGTENLQERVTVASPGYNGSTRAGEFQMTGDNGFGDFAAFCVDIFQYLRGNDTYETPVTLFNASIEGNIDRLFTSVYADVDTAQEAAAFQVSLWEIIYDDGAGFDLDSGSFSTSNNAGVEALAGTYLNGLGTASTGSYEIAYLFSAQGQDLVTATPRTGTSVGQSNMSPIPLPATGLMLLGGLGGFAALRRKKTAA